MTKRRWFWWSNFSVSVWWLMPFRMNGRLMPLVYYSRLANAGRLQFFWLSLMWPLPWAACVRDLPGYGVDYADAKTDGTHAD